MSTVEWRRGPIVGIFLAVMIVVSSPYMAEVMAGDEYARSLVLTSAEDRVYVTGASAGNGTNFDFATLGYSTNTGAQAWLRRYEGPGIDGAWGITVSQNGSRIYVVGEISGTTTLYDFGVVAYDVNESDPIWNVADTGMGGAKNDNPRAVELSPDEDALYVAGFSHNGANRDALTMAFDAESGEELWQTRSKTASAVEDAATALAVSPIGNRAYVSGQTGQNGDFYVIAHNSSTGSEDWNWTFDDSGSQDTAESIVVSSDGETIYVTGASYNESTDWDWATFALTSDGELAWVDYPRFDRAGGPDAPTSLVLSPDENMLFVTGWSHPGVSDAYALDMQTVAYRADDGVELWRAHYDNTLVPGVYREDRSFSIDVTPDGSKVAVSGWVQQSVGYDFATILYDADDGHQRWFKNYNGPGLGSDKARSVVASDSQVFVTGESKGECFHSTFRCLDYATLAYRVSNSASDGELLWTMRYDGGGGDDFTLPGDLEWE